jgi:hypothetical protein
MRSHAIFVFLLDFNEILYERYVIGGLPNTKHFNF